MHSKIVKDDGFSQISLEEWAEAVSKFKNVEITNKLKQQNPRTKEFLFANIPGSGYWTPSKKEYIGWPNDGNVWFRPSGSGIMLIQFEDINDSELNEIAKAVGGTVVPYSIT